MERIMTVTVMVLVLAPAGVLALRGSRWDVTDARLRADVRRARADRTAARTATRRSRWVRGAWGDGAELDPDGAQMRELAAIGAARSSDGAVRERTVSSAPSAGC